jgi:flagellar hook-associated protein 3 FlgL
MRVTEAHLHELATAGLAKARRDVAAAAGQFSSGLRVARPSDDPAAWAEGMRADIRKQAAEARIAAQTRARDELAVTDGALGSIGDAVERALELATQATNGTYDATDRAVLAVAVGQLREQAITAANVRGLDGGFLLAGSLTNAAPFAGAPPGAYSGDARTRAVEINEAGLTVTVSVSGARLTAASGVDVIGTLDALASALAANDTAGVSAALAPLGTAVRQIALARTETGGSMQALDAAMDAGRALAQHLVEVHVRTLEADPVKAADDLARGRDAIERAQAVAARVFQLLEVR